MGGDVDPFWRGRFFGSLTRIFGIALEGEPALVRVGDEPGREVAVIDARKGTTLGVFGIDWRGKGGFIRSHVYTVSGRSTLVTAHDNKVVRQWELPGGKEINEFAPNRKGLFGRNPAWFNDVTSYVDDDGRVVLLVAADDGIVKRVDAVSGRELGEPFRHDAGVHAMGIYTIDGVRYVACGEATGRLWRWEAASGRLAGEPWKAHLEQFKRIVPYEIDGRAFLATASVDQSVQRWDAATSEPLGDLLCHEDTPMGMCVTQADGVRMLVVAYSESLQRYDLVTGESIGDPLDIGEFAMDVCALELDGRTVLFGMGEKTIQRFDAASGGPPALFAPAV
jgi:WD40 repeat protein